VRNRPPASATSTPTSPCITPASTPPARPVPSPWPRPAACTRRSRPSSAAPSRPAAPASPPDRLPRPRGGIPAPGPALRRVPHPDHPHEGRGPRNQLLPALPAAMTAPRPGR
jgi:hypothetical protein